MRTSHLIILATLISACGGGTASERSESSTPVANDPPAAEGAADNVHVVCDQWEACCLVAFPLLGSECTMAELALLDANHCSDGIRDTRDRLDRAGIERPEACR